jgi:hypothetical protein
MTLSITDSSTVPQKNGADFLDEYAGHVATLYETGSRPLTAVGGTANAVTATMAIDLTAAGLVDGLCVSITWAATNTAGVTLALNGGAAIPVLDPSGGALPANTLASGLTSILRYTGGNWRIISAFGLAAAPVQPTFQAFLASGTWTKPSGYDPDTIVIVELWGAGGAGGRGVGGTGNSGVGGGGGGYNRREYRIGDLPSSVAITIGAGGVPSGTAGGAGGNGGDTSFGTLFSAFGGGGGTGPTAATGGGGGGGLGPGSNTTNTGGALGGGLGATSNTATIDNGAPTTIFGGGGGTQIQAAASTNRGGRALFGGGGGSSGAGLGGLSTFGGRGGNGAGNNIVPENGTAPAGGGAASIGTATAGSGARGEARIWIMGN